MMKHDENIESVIQDTREELQKEITKSLDNKTIPKEAILLSKTEVLVYWGTQDELNRIKNKWGTREMAKMPNNVKYELIKNGKTAIVHQLKNGAEFTQIWDTCKVEVKKETRKKLIENATKENINAGSNGQKQTGLHIPPTNGSDDSKVHSIEGQGQGTSGHDGQPVPPEQGAE